MKEKTLLLLFDLIFKKEITKKNIYFRWFTCENYSVFSKYPYKSQHNKTEA